MDDRVKTGIPGLDEMLMGGLPRGGTYAVLGGVGTGKSIFCTAYLYNGIIKHNETGVYVLIEENKNRMKANMKNFGWDLDKLEAEKKLKVIPYMKSLMADMEATFEKEMTAEDPDRVDRIRQFLTIDSLFRQIKESVNAIGAKRVVIDSMTILTLLSNSEIVARMQIMWLIEQLGKMNVTTLVILEEGISYWQDIPFLCDGLIYIILKEKEGIFERGLVIEKMRGTAHDTGLRPIKIGSPDGIKVYPDELVYKSSSKN